MPTPAPVWKARLPFLAAAVLGLLSLPGNLSLDNFFGIDTGGALAATQMSLRGGKPNMDFAYAYGPLTLALQQLSIKLSLRPTWGFEALMLLAALAAGGVASWAVRRLDLDWTAAILLALAAGLGALPDTPVYPLERLAVLAALVGLSVGARGLALACCVAGALVKPSMAYIIGALLLGEGLVWVWRRPRRAEAARRLLLAPLVTAALLTLALSLDLGFRTFVSLALPLTGARHYRAMGFGFFHKGNNPFSLPLGANLDYYLGSGAVAWALACMVLAAGLAWSWRRTSGQRFYSALVSLAATLLFVLFFYGPLWAFRNYMTLPLIGLALLPGLERPGRHALSPRPWKLAVVLLVALSFVPTLQDLKKIWLQGRPSAATAGLWALPEERMQWTDFVRANPPSSHPLFLLGGSPESLFPAYGEPWHSYLLRGASTPSETAHLLSRAYAAHCIAINSLWAAYAPPELSVVAFNLHTPMAHGPMFDSFGCGR